MVWRIEVSSKIGDARSKVKKNWFSSLGLTTKISQVEIVDVYTIDKDLTREQVTKECDLLANSISSSGFFTSSLQKKINPNLKKFSWAFEVKFLPGVTDNIGGTAREEVEDLLKIKFKESEDVYSSTLIFVSGNLTNKDIEIISDNLINSLIQRVEVKSYHQFIKNKGMNLEVPKVELKGDFKVLDVDLDVSDEQLQKIGKEGIEDKDGKSRGPLALSLDYMKAIKNYFQKENRNPTDIELETLAQTWSEHCKHTIFADPIDEIEQGLFKTYIKGATEKIRGEIGKKDFCVSVFSDNSGAIEFDEKYLITHKVETHNSPSALEPFGGAITGIVGVNRDTIGFGLGAKPIVNTYGFMFADPKDQEPFFRDKDLRVKMLSPRRILEGVVEGVNSGGNCSGIPTPQGFLYFDKRYKGKPLVFVGTIGLIPKTIKSKKSWVKKARSGDYIVMVGGRVGLDGIHGATFSSEALQKGSPASAVQIGDPITQKKLSDALTKEARDLELFNSITDNGAGGLSSSVGEMAKQSGGCEVWLDKVPLKYPGLAPWQIWISESQERMTLAVPKNKWQKFFKLMQSRGVEATVIGKFTNSGKCVVLYKSKKVLDLKMQFLHDGLPPRPMHTTPLQITNSEVIPPRPKDLTNTFYKMMTRLNIASFEFISMQYDHDVQAGSVLKPLQGKGRVNSDVTAIRPLLSSKKGVVFSQGYYPRYSDLDTYAMAAASVDTALRNAVAAGANPGYLALIDNFCWCSSDDPKRLWQLKLAAKACFDIATFYKTPFISGKDSMFNDFKGFNSRAEPIKISIPPTLLISSIGVVDDVTKLVSLDSKFAGDLVYLLGETKEELGGSEYLAMFHKLGSAVPLVDTQKNLKLYKAYFKCVQKGLIASAKSVNLGGLLVALAKSAMGGMLGMDISLKNLGSFKREDILLFSESQGRILVTVNPKNKLQFEKEMKGNFFNELGKITGDNKITIKNVKGKIIINADLEKSLNSYRSAFKEYRV